MKDRTTAAARIAIPIYVRRNVADYVAENPGLSFTGVVVAGLIRLGIEIDAEDRPARSGTPRVDLSRYADDATIGVTFMLPDYVRHRIAHYELTHRLTLKQVVLRGFCELGIAINPADLVGPNYSQNARGRATTRTE